MGVWMFGDGVEEKVVGAEEERVGNDDGSTR